MRIAVLLYGQPRFFEQTWQYLKEEFNLPGVEFDFFVHFWEGVGFSPKDDKQLRYIDNTSLVKDRLTKLNVKKQLIEDYKRLDVLCKTFNTVHKFLLKGSFNEVSNPLGYRYYLGQYVSVYNAHCLMEEYEAENNFKYDVVVKARSDFIYKDRRFYKSDEEYLAAKRENYVDDFEENKNKRFAKTIDIIYKKWLPYNDPPQWITFKKIDYFKKDCMIQKRDRYNILRMGDVNIAINRLASDCFFKYFFTATFCTLANDIHNHNTDQLLIYKRHDAMFGDIAILFDIEVKRIKRCRYFRVAYLNSCKETWLRNKHGTIVIDDLNSDIYNEIEVQLNRNKWILKYGM